jgi:hypothetical protein
MVVGNYIQVATSGNKELAATNIQTILESGAHTKPTTIN